MLLMNPYGNFVIQSSLEREKRASARDDRGNPIIRDYYSSPLTVSGNTHGDMLHAKLETVNTGSGDLSSSVFVFNKDQGLPVWSEWLVFNRVNARARKGLVLGPMRLLLRLSNQFSCGSSFLARILCLYSAGNYENSGNSAAAILYSAGNSGNSVATILYSDGNSGNSVVVL
ncbi:hypothetical protein MTR67_012214 [Solanum verrucosum]|uniref:Uncharacterized protein n=1 Tax=Solanum verrucosum TaxID=315347 RepID=A0AAF0QFA8_SOLVR|nr:hypothetical protein MTR67_012214 [Solanum verrucosum]